VTAARDAEFPGFNPAIFQFLEELADNNSRQWFQENRFRYDHEVLEPCLAFIRAFRPRLENISTFFVASERRVGGSLMRVHRDTRFSKDKTPYQPDDTRTSDENQSLSVAAVDHEPSAPLAARSTVPDSRARHIPGLPAPCGILGSGH
jgi:uncharacterized protein (DUF2461 family)